MKYIKQFLIILCITLVAELIHFLLPLPIPASIYGLVLLFVLLRSKVLALASIREVALFLIEIMPLMFIPAGIGLLNYKAELKSFWLPLLVIALATTVIIMLVSGGVTQWVIGAQHKKEGSHERT